MTRTISQRELRNDSGSILRAVHDDGESFIVTTNGTPMAAVVPLPTKPTFVSSDKVLHAFSDLPPMDYAKFRADLDAAFNQTTHYE